MQYKALWEPFHPHWRRLQISQNDEDIADGMDVQGLYYTPWWMVMLDFKFTTGMPMSDAGDTDADLEISIMAKRFTAATKRMFQLCEGKHKWE